MVEFYRTVRCLDVASERGDALLYQWGIYNWGKGEHFEFNLTRQLIRRGGGSDFDIHQLSLTLLFTPSPEFADVGKSDRWCWSVADPPPFESFIRQGPPYPAVAMATPSFPASPMARSSAPNRALKGTPRVRGFATVPGSPLASIR